MTFIGFKSFILEIIIRINKYVIILVKRRYLIYIDLSSLVSRRPLPERTLWDLQYKVTCFGWNKNVGGKSSFKNPKSFHLSEIAISESKADTLNSDIKTRHVTKQRTLPKPLAQ